jgi:hypothetical protein
MDKNLFNISPYMANLRADMGKSAANDLTTLSTFDGPAPETINGERHKAWLLYYVHNALVERAVTCTSAGLIAHKCTLTSAGDHHATMRQRRAIVNCSQGGAAINVY